MDDRNVLTSDYFAAAEKVITLITKLSGTVTEAPR